MEKLEYTQKLLELLTQKTKEGKITWHELPNLITSAPVEGLEAHFRLEQADAFNADWNRLTITQGGASLVSVFNPTKLARVGPISERFASTVQQLFELVAVNPRRERLTRSLDVLANL